MSGIWGVVGGTDDATAAIEAIDSRLCWTGRESVARHHEGRLRLHLSSHRRNDPVRLGDGTLLAVWGNVFGHRDADGYHPRAPTTTDTTTEYVADLYTEHGRDVFARLNGEFVAVLYDGTAETLSLITDRVGSRPLYYTTTGEPLVFGSHIQTLPMYPGVETGFDSALLAEYFAHQTVFGTRTPLEDIRQVGPATVHAFDLSSGADAATTYWRPNYAPSDDPYDEFVERFTALLVRILRERTHEDAHYGLLLSGGGDSRLLLGVLDELDRTVTAYHLNEWENPETAIARRAADLVDVPFRMLTRDRDYQPELLETNAPIFQFSSTFTHGHYSGFAETLRTPDVLLSGKMIEEVIGHHGMLPTRSVRTPLGTAELPFASPIASAADYVSYQKSAVPAFVAGDASSERVLSANTDETAAGEVTFHGVTYPSMDTLRVFSELFPLTNDRHHLEYYHLVQLTDHWVPHLDARMLALVEEYPLKYRLRRNLVYDALDRLDSDLAALPDANSGLAGTAPAMAHTAVRLLKSLRQKCFPTTTPEPHYSTGSWTNNAGLIRTHPFIERCIREHTDLIEAIPGLSLDGTWACYREHTGRIENRHKSLYALATVLEAPVSRHVVSQRERHGDG